MNSESKLLRKRIVTIVITFLCCYVLLILCGCAWQRKLLYFPTKLPTNLANQMAADLGFEPWQNAAGETIGWKMASSIEPQASVLILHGNAGWAGGRDYLARPIHSVDGFNSYVMEYPGYGARGGSSALKSWLAAGEAAIASLPTNCPIYLVSESLGAGVAAHLAGKYPDRIKGLVMLVPYDNLASLAQSKMPLLLPYLFLADRYQPAEWLKGYRGPVFVVIAEQDEVIPPKFGHRLYDSYAGPKRLQIVKGASHNEVAEQSPEWWKTAFEFDISKDAK